MKKAQDIPGTCSSRSAPPEAREPSGAASLNTSLGAESDKVFPAERQGARCQHVDGVPEATSGVSTSARSSDGTGKVDSKSYGGAAGGRDSLTTIDRVLEEALGDGGNGAKSGE